jgi:uroporphyrinogen decarboxylase
VLATLNRQPTDRPPWIEIGFHPTIVSALTGKAVRSGGSGFFPMEDPAAYEREVEIWAQMALDVGLDALALKNWGVAFPSERGHAMDGGTIKSVEDVERIMESTPTFIRESFEACAPILLRTCREAGLACFFETSFGMGVAQSSIGFADLCVFALEKPEIIRRFWDYCEQGFTPLYRRMQELEPDFLLLGDDIAYGHATYLSPQLMRDLVFPHWRRMARKLHLPWIYHSDGNLTDVMDDLLDLGMRGLHPIEPYGTMDIVDLKRQYGDRVTLAGNLDMNIIANGTPQDIQHEVRRLFREVGTDGGWILSSSNSIDGGASPDNVRAMGGSLRELSYERP